MQSKLIQYTKNQDAMVRWHKCENCQTKTLKYLLQKYSKK